MPISVADKARALLAILSGRFLSVGDSPNVDRKEQCVQANTNIGLISALVLTMLVPVMYDVALGAQTNSYMVTEPMWPGVLLFACTAVSTWMFMLSTIFSIVVILIVGETASQMEGRYLLCLAETESHVPYFFAAGGFGLLFIVCFVWLVIVSFNLTKETNCVASVGAEDEDCTYPITFSIVVCCVWGSALWVMNQSMSLVAKLYHVRDLMSQGEIKLPRSSRGASEKPRESGVITDDYCIDPSIKELVVAVNQYFDAVSWKAATPDAFREHLIQKSGGACGLSYRANCIIDKVFDAKVSASLAADCRALCEEHRANPIAELHDFPIEQLDFGAGAPGPDC